MLLPSARLSARFDAFTYDPSTDTMICPAGKRVENLPLQTFISNKDIPVKGTDAPFWVCERGGINDTA